jgi:hypothetical protein
MLADVKPMDNPMKILASLKYTSIEAYLATKEKAESKRKYCAWHTRRLGGGTLNHNQLFTKLRITLGQIFNNSVYRIFVSYVKPHIHQWLLIGYNTIRNVLKIVKLNETPTLVANNKVEF